MPLYHRPHEHLVWAFPPSGFFVMHFKKNLHHFVAAYKAKHSQQNSPLRQPCTSFACLRLCGPGQPVTFSVAEPKDRLRINVDSDGGFQQECTPKLRQRVAKIWFFLQRTPELHILRKVFFYYGSSPSHVLFLTRLILPEKTKMYITQTEHMHTQWDQTVSSSKITSENHIPIKRAVAVFFWGEGVFAFQTTTNICCDFHGPPFPGVRIPCAALTLPNQGPGMFRGRIVGNHRWAETNIQIPSFMTHPSAFCNPERSFKVEGHMQRATQVQGGHSRPKK